jgi:hypothetical protein
VRALWHAFGVYGRKKNKNKINSNKYVSIWRSIVNGSHIFFSSPPVSDAIKGLEKKGAIKALFRALLRLC